MKIVIIGIGKVGKVVTEFLSNEGHNVIIIDKNPTLVEECIDMYDVKGVIGNGASHSVQLEAEMDTADVLIVTTGSDELNILCSLVAKKNQVKHTIIRVRNPEYADQVDFMMQELGISMIINPELETANEIFRLLRFPSSTKIDFFANQQAEIVELKIKRDSFLIGKQLSTIRQEFPYRFLVSTVEREGKVYIPSGNFTLQADDKITITAAPSEINQLFKEMGVFIERSRKVMVVGGGKITHYLASLLVKSKVSLKIVEMNEERCTELAELFPEATIIHADGTDQSVLLEEGIGDTDAFITLTGFDEENIMMSLYAETQKVPKVITKTNHHSYNNILETVGLGSVVSPKFITSNQILRYVRSLNSMGSQVRNLYKLVNNQIEVAEFFIATETSFTHKTFRELVFKDNVLIACLIRRHGVIIPTGDDTLEPGDSVVVVTTLPHINDFQDVLKKGTYEH